MNRMFKALMFLEVNFSIDSAPSQLMLTPNVPSSPSWMRLPLSSCSTRHSHMSASTPFTVPREYTPLWLAMCLLNFSSDHTSDTWFLAYAFSGRLESVGFAIINTL